MNMIRHTIRTLFSKIPYYLKRIGVFVGIDMLLSILSLIAAYTLAHLPIDMVVIFFVTLFNICAIYLFKGYTIVWRYFSIYETKDIIIALTLSHTLFFILSLFYPSFSTRVIIINFAFYLLITVLFRFSKRIYTEILRSTHKRKPLLILIGLSNLTQALIKDYKRDYTIGAIIDDEQSLKNNYISNVRIYPLKDLKSLLDTWIDHHIKILITKDLPPPTINQIFVTAQMSKVEDIQLVKTASNKDNSAHYTVQDIRIEDLLARSPQDMDRAKTRAFIKDKVVLITGAGGSIGSQIAMECVHFGAKQILLLDHSEFNLYKIGEWFSEVIINGQRGFNAYELILKTVIDKESLRAVFEQYHPQIVIHAAAYKHVNIVQENIKEAIINNIIGTKNCIDLSITYKVSSFVLVSTDKAIRPTSVMGATKRVCELYAQNVIAGSSTICAVRFGNVLDSSGSVIPKFKKQISENRPLTVTHREVTRYFMLISEACQLTLQAGSLSKGGEVFILDMGEPIKILDLAKRMLQLYKKEYLSIEFIGLRPGEKLYEELLLDEADKQTQYKSIIIAKETTLDIDYLQNKIKALISSEQPLELLKEIVPEFKMV